MTSPGDALRTHRRTGSYTPSDAPQQNMSSPDTLNGYLTVHTFSPTMHPRATVLPPHNAPFWGVPDMNNVQLVQLPVSYGMTPPHAMGRVTPVYGAPAGHMMISTNQHVPRVGSYDPVAMYSPNSNPPPVASARPMTSQRRDNPNLNVSFSSVVSDVMTSDDEMSDVNMNGAVASARARSSHVSMRRAGVAVPPAGTGAAATAQGEKARVQHYKRQYHTLRRQSSSLLMCVRYACSPPVSVSVAHQLRERDHVFHSPHSPRSIQPRFVRP